MSVTKLYWLGTIFHYQVSERSCLLLFRKIWTHTPVLLTANQQHTSLLWCLAAITATSHFRAESECNFEDTLMPIRHTHAEAAMPIIKSKLIILTAMTDRVTATVGCHRPSLKSRMGSMCTWLLFSGNGCTFGLNQLHPARVKASLSSFSPAKERGSVAGVKAVPI